MRLCGYPVDLTTTPFRLAIAMLVQDADLVCRNQAQNTWESLKTVSTQSLLRRTAMIL